MFVPIQFESLFKLRFKNGCEIMRQRDIFRNGCTRVDVENRTPPPRLEVVYATFNLDWQEIDCHLTERCLRGSVVKSHAYELSTSGGGVMFPYFSETSKTVLCCAYLLTIYCKACLWLYVWSRHRQKLVRGRNQVHGFALGNSDKVWRCILHQRYLQTSGWGYGET